MKYILVCLSCLWLQFSYSQDHFGCKVLNKPTIAQRNEGRALLLKPRSDWPCSIKTIPVNFVFLQRRDGRLNFGEATDGFVNSTISGYDFAHISIEKLNQELNKNEKMNLPPGNSTPILAKNYRFVVHGVYFIKNDSFNDPNHGVDIDSILPLTSIVPDSHFTVFVQSDTFKTNKGGTAGSTLANSKEKYTFNNGWGGYYRYVRVDKLLRSLAAELITNDEMNVLNHELLHLLTLDHTVKTEDGCNCPCAKMPVLYDTIFVTDPVTMITDTVIHRCSSTSNTGVVDTSCNDFCDDTPSAWYMVDTLNAPMHPGEADPSKHSQFYTWFSNNRMEYTGYSALSKCQMDQINNALEDPMSSYLICHKLKSNSNICSFNNFITAYYGRDISINKNCSSSATLKVDRFRYVKTISSGDVEIFDDFEVEDFAYFEVINDCACEF